jgi:hypothetical protein
MNKMNREHFWPVVVQVVPTDDFEVYAYFNDRSIRLYDVKPLLKPGTVFAPLLDVEVFKTALTVMNDTVAWDIGGNRNPRKCLDPFTLFEQLAVADPLFGGGALAKR